MEEAALALEKMTAANDCGSEAATDSVRAVVEGTTTRRSTGRPARRREGGCGTLSV